MVLNSFSTSLIIIVSVFVVGLLLIKLYPITTPFLLQGLQAATVICFYRFLTDFENKDFTPED